VRREAELLHQVANLVVVVPLVHAHPLRLSLTGLGPPGVLLYWLSVNWKIAFGALAGFRD
jgi:hypothetical protein